VPGRWAALIEPPELSASTLAILLEALVGIDCEYLQAHPETPWLYDSGVRYREEPAGEERWQSIPISIERRTADCEDLATWRVAELRVRLGEPATCATLRQVDRRTGRVVWHITVRRANGEPEDPSKKLGMR
jgi:hypothetical protein